MQDIVSPLQAISYTNKDFQTIYPELLDLVKELTNKWDPSISNESDPGVILIKLNALIADKCNYNIDKNVLECFPLSVTQNKNARQLFEQLGYYMKWYNSATSYISLKWIGTITEDVYYPIPPFTMITDEDKTIVYTIIGSIPTVSSIPFSVNTINLPSNGKTVTAKVIQGIAVKYDVNGDTIITPQLLDSNNRLYFNVSNIAENGIFITNTGVNSNYESWVRKDNLVVEALGNTFYKFGVSADGNTCYLEFPEDAQEIMKDGIEITYIRSDGAYGNIQAQQLSNFYSDLTVTSSLNDKVVLNSQNVQLINYFASTDGKDYENINEAYKNYKKVVGTYNTLISLRDYFNYVVRNNLASNGFACDRSNDIQNTYKIMTYNNGNNIQMNMIETIDDDPTLTAFSLKLYFTKYYNTISTAQLYNNTFQLLSDSEVLNVEDYLQDIKSLQHDYVSIANTSTDLAHFCLFKNRYPISCSIVPQYKLSAVQENEVRDHIRQALYKNLNAQEINFGEKILQDYLYKIISEADSRIKNVSIDSIFYNTYAVYKDSDGYHELLVSGDIDDSCVYSVVDSNLDPITTYSVSIDTDTLIAKLVETNNYTYNVNTFVYSSGWKLNDTSVTLANYGIAISGGSPSSGDKILVQISKQTQFRDEILVKSILAGVTPFFIQEEEFDYKFDQSKSTYNLLYNNIKSIAPKLTVQLDNSSNVYTIRNNESIQLYAPNLLQQAVYNNYVKFECHLINQNTIPAEEYYELSTGEYIIFYWKSSASSAKYSYIAYGDGCIIKPTFDLSSSESLTTTATEIYQTLSQLSSPQILSSSDQELDPTSSSAINSLTSQNSILSSDKEIGYYVLNTIQITSQMYCYWVLNNKTVVNGTETYVLFDIGQTERILESGEYFFYTDNEMNTFVSLGTGTKLIRSTSSDKWQVQAIDISLITLNGISSLQGYWYTPPYSIVAEEDQFIHLNSGYTLRLVPKESQTWSATITLTGTSITADSATSLEDFYVYYKSNSSGAEEQQVPDFNLSSSSSWDARAYLSINVSPDVEQILLDNQVVDITDTFDVTTTITGAALTGQSPAAVYYPVCFRSSRLVSSSGGTVIDTVQYESNLTETYLDLFIYSKQLTRAAIVRYIGDNAQLVISSGSSSSSTTNPPIFTLPVGQYLVPTYVPELSNGQLLKLQLKDLTTNTTSIITPIYDSTMTKLQGNKLYPLQLSIVNANHNYSLIVYSVDDSDNPVSASANILITLYNPYKYQTSNNLSKILYLIKKFDPLNVFDYTYVGNKNQIIQNPLEAISFLNINHIFNKFTICQMDVVSINNMQVGS